MPIRRVTLNASPIICLSKAGLADILPALFRDIVVPEAVRKEILAKEEADLKGERWASYKWMKIVDDFGIAPQVASWDLGQGESSVISFVMEHPDFWAVLDDREARRCSTALHCRFIGTLGIIVLAKKRGVIPSIRRNLERLKEAGLWLSDELVDQVCRRSGE
jgi:predicted nucleic acid-binding protein